MSRANAESLLMNSEFNIEGSYLIRQSTTLKEKVCIYWLLHWIDIKYTRGPIQ